MNDIKIIGDKTPWRKNVYAVLVREWGEWKLRAIGTWEQCRYAVFGSLKHKHTKGVFDGYCLDCGGCTLISCVDNHQVCECRKEK